MAGTAGIPVIVGVRRGRDVDENCVADDMHGMVADLEMGLPSIRLIERRRS